MVDYKECFQHSSFLEEEYEHITGNSKYNEKTNGENINYQIKSSSSVNKANK